MKIPKHFFYYILWLQICVGQRDGVSNFFIPLFLLQYDTQPLCTMSQRPWIKFTGTVANKTKHTYNLYWRLRVICCCHHRFCLRGLLLLAWVIRGTRLIIIRTIFGSFLAQKFILPLHHALKCLIIHSPHTVLQMWNLAVYYKYYPSFEDAISSSYSKRTSFGAKSFVFQFAV